MISQRLMADEDQLSRNWTQRPLAALLGPRGLRGHQSRGWSPSWAIEGLSRPSASSPMSACFYIGSRRDP